MNIFSVVRTILLKIIHDEFSHTTKLSKINLDAITVELPRESDHGDMATNAAMILARPFSLKPHIIAEKIVDRLVQCPQISSAEIAGPGFINLRIETSVWYSVLENVLQLGQSFGSTDLGKQQAVNIEYVSANPTGPLHVGHARGAVFGDVLANLLSKVGYVVTKEYYVNDAGSQVGSLARALHYRYLQVLGLKSEADFQEAVSASQIEYGGKYLLEVAQSLVDLDGQKWADVKEEHWLEPLKEFAIKEIIGLIRDDLEALGVSMDIFTSEKDLVESGLVDTAISSLESKGLVFTGCLEAPKGQRSDKWEPRPQLLFKSTQFGDDVDRPLQKSDGSWTYFASDIAYHHVKLERGFSSMINIWGADHAGYVKRMQASVQALSDSSASLDVKLCQLVHLFDNGEPVKMSKRTGSYVTLQELIEAVGRDVVRFFMLTRKNDAQLEFDFAKVTEKSRENPVFYVQYAHARIHSVLRNAAEFLSEEALSRVSLIKADFSLCSDESELALIKSLGAWPRVIESAAIKHEPHRLAFYLYELSSEFHALWNRGNDNSELRFLVKGNDQLCTARIALITAVSDVIAEGLDIFGVEPVIEMR